MTNAIQASDGEVIIKNKTLFMYNTKFKCSLYYNANLILLAELIFI